MILRSGIWMRVVGVARLWWLSWRWRIPHKHPTPQPHHVWGLGLGCWLGHLVLLPRLLSVQLPVSIQWSSWSLSRDSWLPGGHTWKVQGLLRPSLEVIQWHMSQSKTQECPDSRGAVFLWWQDWQSQAAEKHGDGGVDVATSGNIYYQH